MQDLDKGIADAQLILMPLSTQKAAEEGKKKMFQPHTTELVHGPL
jgi:hypothetical protein